VQTRIVRIAQLAVEVHWKSRLDDVSTQGAALTYAAFLSLLPLLLLGLSITGSLVHSALASGWYERLTQSVPGLDDVVGSYGDTLAHNAASLGVIGFVGVLWTASVLTSRAQRALTTVFGLKRRLTNRARAVGITIALGICLLASLALTGVVAGLRMGGLLTVPARIVTGALLFLLELGFFAVAYWLLAPSSGLKPIDHLPGAVVMTLGWTVLKYVGNLVVDHAISRASALYGTIGAVFGLLLAIRIAMWTFLYGAEVSAIGLRERGRKAGSG
jgi:membrane protein